MKLTYPEDIDGATPINGFVDALHNVVNIKPGETIDVEESTAKQIKGVFKFLLIGQEAESALAEVEDVEVVEDKLDSGLKSAVELTGLKKFHALKKQAKELDIDTKGLNAEALEKAIENNNS